MISQECRRNSGFFTFRGAPANVGHLVALRDLEHEIKRSKPFPRIRRIRDIAIHDYDVH